MIDSVNMFTAIYSFMKEEKQSSALVFFVIIVLFISLLIYRLQSVEQTQNILKYALVIGSIPLWFGIFKDIFKGSFGVDIIAGVALIGTFITGQYLAGMIILLMLSGGQLLETYAMNRAKHELSTLLSNMPEVAHIRKGNEVRDISLDEVLVGAVVVIKSGEIIPVDGEVLEGSTMVDESTLTGESVPVEKKVGAHVYAGTQNTGGMIVVQVTKEAHETRFQRIVDLVKNAQNSKAPIVRLADKYSLYFTLYTVAIALGTWFLSQDLLRVVAVLVVATPCPLILATPIAIMSGMSNSSKRGVIVKDGGALETLARVNTFIFDKTGTVTVGLPKVVRIVSFEKITQDGILQIASSLDQPSTHILSKSLQTFSKEKSLSLSYPKNFQETFGDGIEGIINDQTYFLGKKSFILKKLNSTSPEIENIYKEASEAEQMIIFLANSKGVVGAILFQDSPHPEAKAMFTQLTIDGVKNLLLLTGDKETAAKRIAGELGITSYISECLPDDKLKYIQRLQNKGGVVAMVGDGVNDAPALAGADVGIALGTHGKTAASDVADMVILSQSIEQISTAHSIAQKTIYLAKQSIFVGIGASCVAMLFSAGGFITPLYGAILQEGIDVLVILNALRLGSILKSK